MDADIKRLIVDALRSGKYTQGRSRLRPSDDTHCCLGVICDISGQGQWHAQATSADDPPYWTYRAVGSIGAAIMPPAVLRWSGINTDLQGKLCVMNDDGKSFEEIASHIEENF